MSGKSISCLKIFNHIWPAQICGKRLGSSLALKRHKMKKNPCKPATMAADEGIDDDEHGEEVRGREAVVNNNSMNTPAKYSEIT
jgi:hypothetical protein